MTDGNWIKLYRQIKDHELFKGDWTCMAIFIGLILKANWKDGTKKLSWLGRPLLRGEVLIGTKALADESGFGRQVIRDRLFVLEDYHMVRHICNPVSNPAGTVLSIVNYDLYQAAMEDSNPVSNPAITQQKPDQKKVKKEKNKKKINKKEKPQWPESHKYASVFSA